MCSNAEIYEENRIEDATKWIRAYLIKHPTWVPTWDELTKVGTRFKIGDKKVLELYDRLQEEAEMRERVSMVIGFIEKQELYR